VPEALIVVAFVALLWRGLCGMIGALLIVAAS
jgi:hypothetical protein